ncbi:MAG: carbohydrate ABC transporter substrate-binding protein [Armatimonadetes bacterium]|nr:carbohydrate ABC transporter substrate-binding protein [Armatimonadota bacterium]
MAGRPRRGRYVAGAIAGLLVLPAPLFAAPGTLVLRHPWRNAQAPLQALAVRYRRESGIAVRVVCRPEAPSPAQPAPAGHDLIGLPSRDANLAAIALLARAGRAQELSAWMDGRWRARFHSLALRPFLISRANRWGAPPGIYGVPLTLYVRLLLYRPDLLAQAGIHTDASAWDWNDLLAAGQRLRAAGIEPLVGALHPREHPALACMYEPSYLGTSGLCRTYARDLRYLDPQWRAVTQLYVELREAGICRAPLAFAPQADAQRAFLEGRAAILVDGPWFVGVQQQRAPNFTEWKVTLPPWGRGAARFMPAAPGGVGHSVIINPRSTRRQQAARFLRWLTETEAQVTFANAVWMLPAATAATTHPRLHAGLRRFAAHLGDASPDLAVLEDPAVNRVHYEGIAAILQGRDTPEAVLTRVDRLKARRHAVAR